MKGLVFALDADGVMRVLRAIMDPTKEYRGDITIKNVGLSMPGVASHVELHQTIKSPEQVVIHNQK